MKALIEIPQIPSRISSIFFDSSTQSPSDDDSDSEETIASSGFIVSTSSLNPNKLSSDFSRVNCFNKTWLLCPTFDPALIEVEGANAPATAIRGKTKASDFMMALQEVWLPSGIWDLRGPGPGFSLSSLSFSPSVLFVLLFVRSLFFVIWRAWREKWRQNNFTVVGGGDVTCVWRTPHFSALIIKQSSSSPSSSYLPRQSYHTYLMDS